ncbi:acyl CoA:acetate/3-ketoacid CoA transferase [Entomospira culicis]|uniref:Acyl CoA:acetate/3-ketoacid CoA transferase n=1 Tax=Entomospira culicis TaxID=2719989 RepID=A0A968GJW6_9SPIO|nr:acyl CoA:acetate/3-ketoacid CoA transferase [Entomospira culicis]NIZ18990.1 acyl CoA:acetate/3-ketoacid CoA transferase [Entomospira culicis]NIZ69205.1 acyl CoA:acetate/3-ketoacid CoA transferase [Entomospira culicis]WDI37791.1 acyl CoA:acetate/3-ketoacid CoA transferase [Entomospira culicis]WDI39419.1 acyl CoA:acetate/3-ketoacid CoA transferase [Entomospira culicis]
MQRVQFVSAKEAIALIQNNDIVTTGGFIGTAVPEELMVVLKERYFASQSPQNLTIIFAAGQGDGKERGINHLAQEGLVKRMVAGHWGLTPKMGKLAMDNKIEAYNFPQGVIAQAMRALGAGMPGILARTGIGTYIDPRNAGGKVNSKTTEDLVKLITIDNEEFLWFTLPKPTFALLRGTCADKHGNISMKHEALTTEMLAQAIATRNNGGTIVVQVEEVLEDTYINPHDVVIPGSFVDYVVQSSDKSMHMQTFGTQFNEAFVMEEPQDMASDSVDALPLDERKIIARRSALTLDKHKVMLNYGIGMPEGIPQVLREEGLIDAFIPTVEPGIVGGTPAGGLDFGASVYPWAIIDQPYMFDFYDGGGLDHAFLGLAQCDQFGNINVSRFGPKFAGCGGFINITQNAKEVVFCGTFTAGGLKIAVDNGKLNILEEGKHKKFVQHVEQITFSGKEAVKAKKPVTYITERAVFMLNEQGFMLTEIAPGVDLQRDILDQMEFVPLISENLREMDARIFVEQVMNLSF